MRTTTEASTFGNLTKRVVAILVTGTLVGCGGNPPPELGPGQRLPAQVRQVLGEDWASAEYQESRAILLEMGQGLDPILVDLIEDRRASTAARASCSTGRSAC